MTPVRYCTECEHCSFPRSRFRCAYGHKPPFKCPDSPLDDDWGWHRVCTDYKPTPDARPDEPPVTPEQQAEWEADERERRENEARFALERECKVWANAGAAVARGDSPRFVGDKLILLRSE